MDTNIRPIKSLIVYPFQIPFFFGIPSESRLASMFPRSVGTYRFDKAAEDATTVKEIVEMYRNQLKKVEG